MRAMQIPGHIDPVAVPRGEIARADGRVDVVGLTRAELREALIAAGIAEKQAKMRAQQIWHWIYNRGATDFSAMRSEEHTSELQSLMRISYAVFCLKKKTKQNAT